MHTPRESRCIHIRIHKPYDRQNKKAQTAQTLQYWAMMATHFPLLANTACRFLCIPPSSADAERLFSAAGDVVTAKRNRLAPEAADVLIFIEANFSLITK